VYVTVKEVMTTITTASIEDLLEALAKSAACLLDREQKLRNANVCNSRSQTTAK